MEARVTIANGVLSAVGRTPLVRLNAETAADVYLKLENLQPIGSFKIRGAANVMSRTPREKLERGDFTEGRQGKEGKREQQFTEQFARHEFK